MAEFKSRHRGRQIDALGVEDTKEILDQVRAAVMALRSSGGMHSG